MKTFTDIMVRSHDNPGGFEISWAGANPFGDGFCFGSENGLLQFMDKEIRPIGPGVKASLTGDAINSVTGAGSWLAASTRREITFIGKANLFAKPEILRLPFGAYHLAYTSNGFIVAAVGRNGLVFVNSKSPKKDLSAIRPSSNSDMFAYSVLTLPGDGGKEVIACAGRTSGIMFCEWQHKSDQTKMQSIGFPNLDVIDVCNVATDQSPRAIAGASVDGTVVLARDVLNDNKPMALKFASIRGTVYGLAHCKGHLFVLTSDGVLVLWNLAKDFTEGFKTKVFDTPNLMIPMKAVEMNIVMNRYLTVATIDGIQIIDIDSISGPDIETGGTSNGTAAMKNDGFVRMEWETEKPELSTAALASSA